MPDDSPYNAPPVIRALVAISQALLVKPQRAPRELPPNAGKAWTQEEDKSLAQAFDGDATTTAMMQVLGRSRASVEARLIKLGKLTAKEGSVPFHARAALPPPG